MGRGTLHGTFYVPSAPSIVPALNLNLTAHETNLCNRIDREYDIQLIKKIFSAVDARVSYNMDMYEINRNINHDQHHPLTQHHK